MMTCLEWSHSLLFWPHCDRRPQSGKLIAIAVLQLACHGHSIGQSESQITSIWRHTPVKTQSAKNFTLFSILKASLTQLWDILALFNQNLKYNWLTPDLSLVAGRLTWIFLMFNTEAFQYMTKKKDPKVCRCCIYDIRCNRMTTNL